MRPSNLYPESADQEKKARDRVTSTPDRWTKASALGFSTFTVTRSLPKSTVTMRATKVAKASTVWNDVSSTFYNEISIYQLGGPQVTMTYLGDGPRHGLVGIDNRRAPGKLARTLELQ